MSPLSQAGLLLINSIGSLVLLVIVLRFMLQIVRADFYNPMSQMIVKFTNPMLLPLRRIIPGFGGLDIASLVLALVAQYLLIALVLMVAGFGAHLPFVAMIGWAFVGLGSLLLNIYFWGLLIVIIASWIAPNSYNPALILINQIIDPVMRPIRNKMPDLGGLDLSPMVLMLGIKVIEILVLYPLKTVLSIPSGIIIGL